jgi:lipopolysaccharide/colanic/teichoic acid biosynthesis glycosyltransferase
MNRIPATERRIIADTPGHVPAGSTAYPFIKRTLDILGSLFFLLLFSPLFLLIAFIVKLESPGPVFFLQTRLGRHAKQFGMFKFRTIHRKPTPGDIAGSHTAISGKDSDITRFGRFLRNSGLNELPQLINIFRGEMSFVGPRPAVLYHEQYYTEWHRRRLNVLPGVTGLAQICGRNVIPWGWRVALDRYYVDNMSFSNDLVIFCKTFPVVLGHVGTEGAEDLYFDFTPPVHGYIERELESQGIWRTFLRHSGEEKPAEQEQKVHAEQKQTA